MSALAQKIRTLWKSLALKQEPFARLVGVTQSTVSKWESGSQVPDTYQMLQLAQLAKADVTDFWNEDEREYTRALHRQDIRVIGTVQAGNWVEAPLWDPDSHFDFPVPENRRWKSLPINGFLVKGSSMDLYYPEGAIVLVISTVESGIEPRHSDRVVVQRMNGDQQYELTLKEYVIDKSGNTWLWPRSTDPEYQTPINVLATDGPDEIVEVQVIGIVVASFVVERPDLVFRD